VAFFKMNEHITGWTRKSLEATNSPQMASVYKRQIL